MSIEQNTITSEDEHLISIYSSQSLYGITTLTTGSFNVDPNTNKVFNVLSLVGSNSTINPTTALITTSPAKGTIQGVQSGKVTLKQTGSGSSLQLTITYVPTHNAVGSDSFKMKLQNGNNTSGETTISVNIGKIPTVKNSSVTCKMNTPTTFNISSNITNGDATTPYTGGTGYTVIISKDPSISGATATINKTTITYTPKTDWVGADGISYLVTNPGGQSATGSLSINVIPLAPSLTTTMVDKNNTILDTFVVGSGTATTINFSSYITTNHTGLTNVITLIHSPASTLPTKGSISVSTTETKLTYTPKSNMAGTDKFSIKFENTIPSISGFSPVLSTISAGVNIIISGISPIATGNASSQPYICKKNVKDSAIVSHNITLPVTTFMNDKTYKMCITTAPAHGDVSFIIISNVLNMVYTPNDDYVGSDTITFVVRDNTNKISPPSTIYITVSDNKNIIF